MRYLIKNAKIFTSDTDRPYASSMLIENGRITALDAPDGISDIDETVDVGGKTIIPGFVDAHMHPLMLAEYSRQIACLPPDVNSISDLKEKISRAHDRTEDGGWIRGWGYDEGKYSEHRSPNRYDLDEASPDKPVLLVRCCEHVRCVNSRALEIAGITRDTPDPPGGRILRDDKGEPTGILTENARDLILPFMKERGFDETVDALVDLGRLLSSQGIVAVADMGNLHPGSNLDLLTRAAEKGFRQRAALYYMWDYFMDDPGFDISPELMDHGKRIRVAGLKLIGDGSISGRTAWLYGPYKGSDDHGMPVYSDESMERAISFARKKGCQISVHAMGGRAIDRAVGRFSDEDDWTDGEAPFIRIEHVTEPTDQAMDIAREKGFFFVSQPIFEYCEIETYNANLGKQRLKHLYPYASMLKKGVRLAFSSDAPATAWAEPSDPFTNIKAAVTRKAYNGEDIGQDERIDVETAVRLYTCEAARACGFSGLGRLKEGYSADFLILSDDIFSMDPEKIGEIKVESTFIEGEKVYYCFQKQ